MHVAAVALDPGIVARRRHDIGQAQRLAERRSACRGRSARRSCPASCDSARRASRACCDSRGSRARPALRGPSGTGRRSGPPTSSPAELDHHASTAGSPRSSARRVVGVELAGHLEPARFLEAAQRQAERFALLAVDHPGREAVRAHQHLGMEQGAVDRRAGRSRRNPARLLIGRGGVAGLLGDRCAACE